MKTIFSFTKDTTVIARVHVTFALLFALGQVTLADYQVPDSWTNPKTTIKIGTGIYAADADDELHGQITREDHGPEPGFRGPSIAAAAVMQDDASNVKLTDVEAIGFKFRPDVMTPKDLLKRNVKEIGGPAPEKAAKAKTPGGKGKGKKRSERQFQDYSPSLWAQREGECEIP